jgi:hypothetical protein|tara:strand:- start:109 stop:330 length:222 start_codon:yes stop_codon:yes gene_type:complete
MSAVMATLSAVAPARATRSTAAPVSAKPAFMGASALSGKAALGDAFCAMSLGAPATRKQSRGGLCISGASSRP